MDSRSAARRSPAASTRRGEAPGGAALGGGSLIQQIARELSTALDRQLAAFDLTGQQAALLMRAARHRDSSPSRLKAVLGTDTAGMTRLLDRLEAKGLLRRRPHPEDRRAIVIELTEQARPLIGRLGPIFRRVNNHLWAGFTPDEIEQHSAALQRMLDNLRGDDARA